MSPADLRRMLVTDRRLLPPAADLTRHVARQVRRCGATCVLLREKDLPRAELAARARELVRLLEVPLLVAHIPEAAAESGAAGVSLGWSSPTVARARECLPGAAWVGIAVHGLEEGLRRASSEHPDFMLLGPVLPTPSKEGLAEPVGLGVLEELARRVQVPVVGIGGLVAADEERVLATGAAGWAAIRGLFPEEAP